MTVSRQTFRSPLLHSVARTTEWAAPFLRLYAHLRCPSKPLPASQWRTALLIGADHIGDVLYTTPSLPALKNAFPSCEWLFSTSGPAFEILEHNPWVTPVPLPSRRDRRSTALKEALRGKAVDAIICYNSGGYGADLMTALELGIASRAGYVHKGCSAWVTHPVAINFPQPYPAYFRDLVSQLTGQPGNWPLRPLIYPSVQDTADADTLWTELRLGHAPVLACFPFTRQPTHTWSANNFVQVLKSVAETTGALPLLCGGPDDGPGLSAVAEKNGLTCPILAGRLNLRALTVFLRRTTVVFANDSGPRHLANAAGVPVAFIRNLWPRRIETGTYLDTETDLAPVEDCLGGEKLHSALSALKPEAVAERLIEMIQSRLVFTASASRSAVT